MTKLYVTEFPGLAATVQSDSVDIAPEPATQTQVINTAATTGNIATLGAITAGTLYTNGSYTNVPLTGGTGSGATANITVSGGGVTAVTLVNRGTGYTAADSLSASAANIGGTGSGFAVAVSTLTQQITLLPSTRFVELAADGICSFRVGLDPVATTSDARLPANNQPLRRGIQAPTGLLGAGQTQWKLSAITNT
jgi:hypothetical protein